MASYVVSKVGRELSGYQRLRDELSKGYDLDPATLLDTLEGETELHESLLVVYEEMLENGSLLSGLESTIEALQTRAGRLKKTNETLRNVILSAMDKADLKTVKGPLATLTARKGKPAAIIDEESEIPSTYFEPQPPKLDKKAIKTALDNGDTIPGAHLSNGGISLTIRVK